MLTKIGKAFSLLTTAAILNSGWKAYLKQHIYKNCQFFYLVLDIHFVFLKSYLSNQLFWLQHFENQCFFKVPDFIKVNVDRNFNLEKLQV